MAKILNNDTIKPLSFIWLITLRHIIKAIEVNDENVDGIEEDFKRFIGTIDVDGDDVDDVCIEDDVDVSSVVWFGRCIMVLKRRFSKYQLMNDM